jgi:hypothetical protein
MRPLARVMITRIILIVFLYLATTLLSGCTPLQMIPIVGASYEGYSFWKSTESTRYYAYDLDRTFEAVKRSCERLKLGAWTQNLGPRKGYSLETKGDHPMEIDVLQIEREFTSVVIRIGLFEDKQYVEFFFRIVDETIQKKTPDDKEKSVPRK